MVSYELKVRTFVFRWLYLNTVNYYFFGEHSLPKDPRGYHYNYVVYETVSNICFSIVYGHSVVIISLGENKSMKRVFTVDHRRAIV